ncbi:MAG: hypothetical protein ACK55I_27320 [bacterium]
MNNDLAEWDDKEFAEELRDMFWVEFSQISVTIGQSMAGTSPSSSDDIERESRKKVHITINMSNSTCQNISINTGADDRDSDDESE